jgi:hypothetical protein
MEDAAAAEYERFLVSVLGEATVTAMTQAMLDIVVAPEPADCFCQGRGFRAPRLQCGPGPARYDSNARLRDLSRAQGVPHERRDDHSGVDALADHRSGVRVVV